jgi:hypothetical protein
MTPEDPKSSFKVIDKRASSGNTEEEAKQGSGFTMKESATEEALPHQIDFSTLVFSFATGAMIHLGLAPDPATQKKAPVNLDLARQNIDILGVLKEKTKGNLNPEEEKMLEAFLSEIRVLFVQVSKK